jgi:hypothetical protein
MREPLNSLDDLISKIDTLSHSISTAQLVINNECNGLYLRILRLATPKPHLSVFHYEIPGVRFIGVKNPSFQTHKYLEVPASRNVTVRNDRIMSVNLRTRNGWWNECGGTSLDMCD